MKNILITATLLLAATAAGAADLVEAIVVRVGDRIITRSQYEKRLADLHREIEQTTPPEQVAQRKEQATKQLVDDLISELLIKDRADRIGITVSQEEINEAIVRLKQQYNITTDEQFEASLRQSGMSRADMEARLRETLITNKVFARELRNRAELDDRELRERYNREKDRYRLPERARLREIVIVKPSDEAAAAAASQRAADIAAQVRAAGADFAQIATTASEAGTKERGGDLGEVARGELLPNLDEAVFNATAGTILGPIETRSGWHILKVEQRLPSEVPAFESVKDRLRRDASEETFQRDLKAYLDNLRKDAFIQIHEKNVPRA
ncbi:MAG TPA: peptidyl-prolyl cis-trans isomerase [Thermoanaerobaculia bacterium]|nr:peptidyl-prolyl cis-trans isomerase [Thermoanaerobaculia bacterium]